ncbi:MAG: hypothetical protein HY516_03800 [Candidatus Aenigmarchaeota archaeon]|nr:hypothetical protein [Candidatus Aenigmarchaeota archaeon]
MAKKRRFEGTEESILQSLRSAAEWGMTIEEVAEKNRINRVTASKYLAILEVKGLVILRVVGRAKLYALKK